MMRIKIDRARFPVQGIAGFVAVHADIALAAVLLSVLALLVLPVPSFLLDLAIALNFSFAMLLLASAIYIRSALDLATFPSLLLLTTLFRLGLAVATTKMILLHAHAGHIIQTFGRMVVGGNVVVGLVIFAVLCAVQFIVVAKGSDRVAEVAARFTLDSIPGKQMSIDADLRAGAITNEQAKERRDTLQRETQLHGAMDGAMKFVKGDAIIGIVIALVNIIGGIVIGTGRGMSMGEAAQTYVVLTVGDGLVSQIPSLIVSIAAGLIITRGDGRNDGAGESDADGNLGRSIFDQLGRRFRPLAMGAVGALLLACIPGFPHLQFIAIGMVLLALALATRRMVAVEAVSEAAPMRNMTRDGATYVAGMLDTVEMGTSVPLCVRIGEEAFGTLDPGQFDDALGHMRDLLMRNIGLPFPGLSMRGERDYPGDRYGIEVYGEPAGGGWLPAGKVFVAAHDDGPSTEPRPAAFAEGIGGGAWVDAEAAAALDGAPLHRPWEVLTRHLYAICAARASAFLGTQETTYLLERLSILFPDLVESIRRTLPVPALARVLRALLDEGISIRNLRSIGEALVKSGGEVRVPELALRHVRVALRRQIVADLKDMQSGKLPVLLLEPACERLLAKAVEILPSGESRLALDSHAMTRVGETLRQAAAIWGNRGVVLTSALVRAHLADLIRHARWPVKVLAMDELALDMAELDPLGVIELAPDTAP